MRISAAILARASDNRDGESGSVEGQVRRGRQAASELGWDVTVVHDVDDGFSASRFATKAREGWLALLEDIKSGKVNAVIMRTTSRGSRQMGEWVEFLDLARDMHVLVHVIQDRRTYDPARYRDRKSLLNAGTDAEAFSDELSETIKEGVETAMLSGAAWSHVPLGLAKVRAENGKATGEAVLTADAPRVRRLFEMVDQGHSINAASKETGIYRQQALALLKKLAYIGKRRVNGELVDCRWPAIVPEATFWRVQAILAANPGAGKRPGAYRSLLAHFARCGKCGGEVITEKRSYGRAYRCNGNGCFAIRETDADPAALYFAAAVLMGDSVLERYLPRDDDSAAAMAQAEADRLQAELDEWLSAGISPRAYAIKEGELLPQIEAATARAEELRRAGHPALRPLEQFAHMDLPEVWQRADAAFTVLAGLPLNARRDLLRQVFDVKLYPKKLAAELNIDQVEVTER